MCIRDRNYSHPNSFSGMALGTLPFIFYFFSIVDRYFRLILLVQLLFSLNIIIFTGSRTGYVALVIGLLFFILKSSKPIKTFFTLLIVLLIAMPLIPSGYIERAETIFTQKDKEGKDVYKRQAYYVGNKYKIPVIIDMAENYPAMIQDTWQFQGPNPFDYLIRNPILLRKLERWIIPKLNGIWVVSEASRRRVEGITGCRNLMWVVGNTPRIQESQASKPHPFADMLKTKNALRLLYVGGLEKTRGLQTVLLSLPIAIKKLGKNIHLLLSLIHI